MYNGLEYGTSQFAVGNLQKEGRGYKQKLLEVQKSGTRDRATKLLKFYTSGGIISLHSATTISRCVY